MRSLPQSLSINSASQLTAIQMLNQPMSENAYYRSRIITTLTGVNQLVASITSLLAFIGRIHLLQQVPNFYGLQQYLVHEIHAAETQLHNKHYSMEIIRVTRYVLCATIDELLLKHYPEWERHQLANYFQSDTEGSERFFVILQRLSGDTQRHIELLELMYICLSLGFEGKYANDKATLDKTVDKLFDAICQQRGENVLQLHVQSQAPYIPQLPEVKPLSLSLFLGIAGTLLFSLYSGFSYMLGVRATPILELLTNILQHSR
ncbi:MAG: type IVB secretion system protein IcmH/DotU [Gammaproteobacteria bacterium]